MRRERAVPVTLTTRQVAIIATALEIAGEYLDSDGEQLRALFRELHISLQSLEPSGEQDDTGTVPDEDHYDHHYGEE